MASLSYHLAQAQSELARGRKEEARRLLLAIVDQNPQQGKAWYLLSRCAETAEQRVRFLRRAQAAGYLPASETIDDVAPSTAAVSAGEPHALSIEPDVLRPGPGGAALKGASVALLVLAVVIALVLACNGVVVLDLGALLLTALIGASVGIVLWLSFAKRR